jgi:hypothetical protein
MRFFDRLPNSKEFAKFYKEKPHLLKKHQKDFKEHKDKYLNYINNYQDKTIHLVDNSQLKEYEKYAYCNIEQDGTKIILSYYQMYDTPYLLGRAIIENDKIWTYVARYWKYTNIRLLLKPNQSYMSGGRDDFMYIQEQQSITDRGLSILKSLPEFKYLPIDKFWKVSVMKLFNINSNLIYQLELLLKAGYIRLASDMLYHRKFFDKKELETVRPILKTNIRLQKITDYIDLIEQREKERKERLTQAKLAIKLEKMKKVSLEIGDFIIKTPFTASELKQEGLQLKHCVYTYLERIVANKTKVLFLRKKTDPDTPFYTIEIKDKEVMQVRGEHNKTQKKYIKLVNEWYEKGLLKELA